jgi:hypothetical protein
MEMALATRIAQWRAAWIALALTLALHVTDEALSGFLPLYHGVAEGIRSEHPWAPLPTVSFPVWLGGLLLAVLVLLALTPFVSRGAQWIRVFSFILGGVMIANALGHLGVSLYRGQLVPGVYSSPLVLISAVALLITASRA